jgi:hypothetical protein
VLSAGLAATHDTRLRLIKPPAQLEGAQRLLDGLAH